MAFLIGGANTLDDAYSISNSLRFNDGDNHYLERTFDSSGSQRKFTVSLWAKRSELSTGNNVLWAAAPSNGGQFSLTFNSSDQLILREYNTTDEEVLNLVTSGVFRDPAAWYHIVAAVDTTQSTNTNRAKLYVNGTLQALGTATYPNQNYDLLMNNTTNTGKFFVGNETYSSTSAVFDGYIAEFFIVNDSQLAPTAFGKTDDNGVWIPIDCKADLTFGANGLYLEFKQTGTSQNSSGIGADTSGEDHHFAIANNGSAFAATDVTTDTPTNNFATYNPLTLKNNPGAYYITFSEGNLKIAGNSATNNGNGHSTMGFNRGKWYYEVKIIDVQGDVYPTPGVVPENLINDGDTGSSGQIGYNGTDTVGYGSDGDKVINDSGSSYGNTYTDNDIIGIAIDCDNGAVYFSKNGTFQNSGDPTSGSSKTNAAMTFTPSKYYFLGCSVYQSTSIVEANFGNPPFSISSGNADANGYGNFEHAVPSGYYSLCTKNLAEFG